jgi:hypothetical protein
VIQYISRFGRLTAMYRDPSKPGAAPPAKWDPKVLGMNKRDLLKEVLPILGPSSSLVFLIGRLY